MKISYRFALMALIAGVMFWPAQRASAQDTLTVECWEEGEVIVNALWEAIVGDTTAAGVHVAVESIPNRVYKLKKGGFYHLTDRIENDGFHLRIVGEEPGETLETGPAVIQMVEDAEGNVDGRIITGKASVTLKNLWISGNDDAGVQTYYQPIQMDASDSRFVFENVVLSRTNFAPIAFTGTGNDIFYRDCVFRNLIGRPSTQQWEGRGISIWADQDTVVVENCTFFNIGMTAFQLEGGAANYIRFNHNTLVNVGRSINAGNWWREAYFANNLIVNGWWHSQGADDLVDPDDPRDVTSGLFSIGDLPSMYGPEEGRRIVFANANSWRDPVFAEYYADSLLQQPFINPVSKLDYLAVYDLMLAQDTTWLDPVLATTFDAAQYDSMIQNIEDLRGGVTPATPYFWQLPKEDDGTINHTGISWPLPEDFTYTNTDLLTAGTDDLPLGDLNWFPTDKATWETDRIQLISDIENLAGEKRVLSIVGGDNEAENGILSGTAEVETFEGFSYFQMDGGGYIEWVFDLTTAGQYDLNIWTHMRDNNMRGQRIIVNGTSIHDAAHGWGEYIWDDALGPHTGMVIDAWTWTLIEQDSLLADEIAADVLVLPAGANTIRIESSWGWQNFAGFDLLEAGTETVALELRAPDVTDYSIVTPMGEGAPWVAQGFKSVALGTDGGVILALDVPTDGDYRIQIYYQNYSGLRTGEIQIGGGPEPTTVLSVDFASDEDSTGLGVLSDLFAATAGPRTLVLSGDSINVDYVQLIEDRLLSTRRGRDVLPEDYVLAQNYPNPFNPVTTIRYTIPRGEMVKLVVYNILGQHVITLVNERTSPGTHSVIWNGTDMAGRMVSSGVYFYRIKAGDFIKTRKFTLLR